MCYWMLASTSYAFACVRKFEKYLLFANAIYALTFPIFAVIEYTRAYIAFSQFVSISPDVSRRYYEQSIQRTKNNMYAPSCSSTIIIPIRVIIRQVKLIKLNFTFNFPPNFHFPTNPLRLLIFQSIKSAEWEVEKIIRSFISLSRAQNNLYIRLISVEQRR